MSVNISSLTIYPVKSMAGVSLATAELDEMGLRWDRRWMLIDDQGQFLTARKQPSLLCIQPEVSDDGQLTLQFPSGSVLPVPSVDSEMPEIPATVWDDSVKARHLSNEVDTAISDYLGQSARLVFVEQETIRQVDLNYAQQGDRTGFSDGFPLLLISEASLADLNQRMDKPLPMTRFRPNIVVSGCEAYEEDAWGQLQSPDLTLDIVKPCSRCIMTTVDPASGERDGKEPLATLKTYRQIGNKVMFGQNVIHRQTGQLQVGQTLTAKSKS